MSALGSGSSAAMAKLSTTDVVRAQLRGKRVRLGETAVTILLLSTLLIALAVLVLLMVDIVRTAWPVISTRPGSFITSTNSTFPETAGIKQALIGSLLMMVFVVVLAFPLGIG